MVDELLAGGFIVTDGCGARDLWVFSGDIVLC
jgi:hypothetical protein